MRLIEADAVKEIIKSGVSTDTYDDIEYVCGLIDELPTIEPKRKVLYFCKCHACGARTKVYPTWEEAIRAWNRRQTERSE